MLDLGDPTGGDTHGVGDLTLGQSLAPTHLRQAVCAGFRFPPEVILLAVRCYLRYGLSSGDLEELLAERGIAVDHVNSFRWVQRSTPLLIDVARTCGHQVGDRWFVDEAYVKVNGCDGTSTGRRTSTVRVIEVFASGRRDIASARRLFATSLMAHGEPVEVITDSTPALANVIDDLISAAFRNTGQFESNRCECDHG